MASIKEIQTKNGITYKVTVCIGRTESGKQILRSRSFVPDPSKTQRQNKKELDRFVFLFEEKCRTGQLEADRKTLEQYANEWMKNYAEQELEKTTVSRYRHALDQNILPAIGFLKLSEIKPSTVQGFLNGMREKGYKRDGKWYPYSKDTVRSCKVILSSILSGAFADDLISLNPCIVRQRKHKKVGRKEVRCFSIEEAARFLDIIEKPIPIMVPPHRAKRHGKETVISGFQQGTLEVSLKFQALFTLTIFSGLRRGELLGLQWRDIDFDAGTLVVDRTVQYTPQDGLFIKPPKSQSGYREMFLPSAVMTRLRKLKTEQQKKSFAMGTAWHGSDNFEENFVFTQEDGKPMFPSTPRLELNRILTTYNKSCKRDADKLPVLTLHELRHTSASILIASGVEATAVAKRLGHSDASITLQVYAHSFRERDRVAADALEDALGARKMG